MPKILSEEEKARRAAEKAATQLSPAKLRKRREAIYGTSEAGQRKIAALKTNGIRKTLAEGRKSSPHSDRSTGVQKSLRLDLDIQDFALSHTPFARYVNELIRRDMLAQQTPTNENFR